MMQTFSQWVSLLTRLPLILVWLVGIGVAIALWRKHPRVSLLAVVIFGIALVFEVLSSIATATLPLMLHSRFGMRIDNLASVFAIINILNGLVQAGVWALVIYAIFGWRSRLAAAASAPDTTPPVIDDASV